MSDESITEKFIWGVKKEKPVASRPIRTDRHIKTGSVIEDPCTMCGGTGEIWSTLPDDVGSPFMTICKRCGGKGEIELLSGHPATPLTKSVKDVVEEYKRASSKFPPFKSDHEGYAIILEELDELWDEIKKKEQPPAPVGAWVWGMYKDKKRLREEAVQVAAMALRFLVDLT
jgi:NTP pyrophosphatase (non-canonical NTP hydrolase)